MRIYIALVAGVAFCAASQAAAAKPAFEINKTTWIFTDKDGTKINESIDAKGNFIVNTAAGKHLDHGRALVKDDKVCFTSAMTKEGEVCWTTKPVKVGQSMDTVSDKGEKLKVTRIAYKPLEMPK